MSSRSSTGHVRLHGAGAPAAAVLTDSHRERIALLSATNWPNHGSGQVWLLLGSLVILVGSVLPWITLGELASINGLQTAGLWTFYLAWLGVAAGLVPWRRAVVGQGTVAVIAAIGLPAWQVLRLSATGLEGWAPGLGLYVVVLGGSMAARGVVRVVATR